MSRTARATATPTAPTDVNSYQENSEGLVNVSDINANVPVNALNCDEVDLGLVPIDVKQVTAPITGALALFGSVETEQTTLTDNSCSTNQTSAVDTSAPGQRLS